MTDRLFVAADDVVPIFVGDSLETHNPPTYNGVRYSEKRSSLVKESMTCRQE